MFLQELNKAGLLESFTVIDVLKTPMDVSKVRVVPTIVLNHQRVLSGREAFGWLQNEKKNTIGGVESQDVKGGFGGTSSVFSYIEGENAFETSMSTSFTALEDPEPSRDVQSNTGKGARVGGNDGGIDDRMAELKRERGMS